jgi:hypothetical protein
MLAPGMLHQPCMTRRYSLIRPVVAFREDTNAVVNIPAGASVELITNQPEPVGV